MPFSEHIDALLAAAERQDVEAFQAALPGIARDARSATPQEAQTAVERMLALVERLSFGVGSQLTPLVGGLAGLGTDPTVAVPLLTARAIDVMEQAAAFDTAYRAAFGEPPSPEDQAAAEPTLIAFADSAADRGQDPYEAERMVEAWFCADDWVQPVLYLCQRADVRAMLPQRERLAAAIDPVREIYGTPTWLDGLMRVLDDEPLIVLDRDFARTGNGYRVTIGGIGDNFQLHTLLAAALIGDRAAGLLPGRRPAAEEIAAATDGDPQPAAGITGTWNLVGADGERIWNEGRPADIPHLDGTRVVVLDAEAYRRTWNTGRGYPLMAPTLRVDGRLTPDEARHWLGRVKPAAR